MPKLILKPEDKTVEIDANTSILESLNKQGIILRSSCGGHATCTDCIVKVVEGKEHLNEMDFEERNMLGTVFHITKERLACQTKISGDVVLDISDHV